MAELADAQDSKSCEGNLMRVRFSPAAHDDFVKIYLMYEYSSEAVVLDRLPNGDLDERVVFLTKRFGKIVAKAKSVKKMTSKLSGHLQPGNLVQIRLVEKNDLQVVDALKKSKSGFSPRELAFLGELLAELEPDVHIWEMFTRPNYVRQNLGGRAGDWLMFPWKETLKVLGWDASFASCSECGAKPHSFKPKTQEFFCKSCASKLRAGEILFIDNG